VTKRPRPKKNPRSYCLYVVDLDPRVWRERKKMRDANPRFNPLTGKGFLYVGMTSSTPEKRFKIHMAGGIHAAPVVTRYGRYLRPKLYNMYERMEKLSDAEEMEVYLAGKLRRQGFAVWPVKEGGAFTMTSPNRSDRRPRKATRPRASRRRTQRAR
jgi:hypothetical protein